MSIARLASPVDIASALTGIASMPATGRLFVCARCRAQVIVCRRCDRGQIYCDGDCSLAARQSQHARGRAAATSAAAMAASRTPNGCAAIAARQNKVTHQGSAAPAADALLASDPDDVGGQSNGSRYRQASVPAHCHFCHCVCSALRTPRATAHVGSSDDVRTATRLTQDTTHDHRSRTRGADPALLPRREVALRHHRAPIACAPRHGPAGAGAGRTAQDRWPCNDLRRSTPTCRSSTRR